MALPFKCVAIMFKRKYLVKLHWFNKIASKFEQFAHINCYKSVNLFYNVAKNIPIFTPQKWHLEIFRINNCLYNWFDYFDTFSCHTAFCFTVFSFDMLSFVTHYFDEFIFVWHAFFILLSHIILTRILDLKETHFVLFLSMT